MRGGPTPMGCSVGSTAVDIHTVGVYPASVEISFPNPMNKRINIVLPDTTVSVLDRVATKGARSRFIDRAVLHYIETQGKHSLREQLAAGYRANAARDLAIAAEWFPIEEEAWKTSGTSGKPEKPTKTKKA